MLPLVRRFALFLVVSGIFLFFLNHITGIATGKSKVSDGKQIPTPGLQDARPNSASRKPILPEKPWQAPTGKFRWGAVLTHFPVEQRIPYPSNDGEDIPRIQFDFSQYQESADHKNERERRKAAIQEAFQHSWNGYKKNAWLHDELKPVSGSYSDPYGGWAATLVDTLDTLWIMGMESEYAAAVNELDEIDFTSSPINSLSIFETTIRYLGGILSAYELSNFQFPTLLEKAAEMGDMLYKAFDTPNRMPVVRWDWKGALNGEIQKAPSNAIIAEPASLTLEFTKLTEVTGMDKYFDAVQRIADIMYEEQNRTAIPGLWPLAVDLQHEDWHSNTDFRFGGMVDSAYEYLPKQHLLLGGRRPEYRAMYLRALDAVKKYLAFQPMIPDSIKTHFLDTDTHPPLFLGVARADLGLGLDSVLLSARGEHLTCFAGGMVALGARLASSMSTPAATRENLEVAQRLAEGCVWSYAATASGVGPEIFAMEACRKGRDAVTLGEEPDWQGQHGDCTWSRERWLKGAYSRQLGTSEAMEDFVKQRNLPEGMLEVSDPQYQLRPEALETLFIMYRITGEERYQDMAWSMFEAINKTCRTDIAYAVLSNVLTHQEIAADYSGKEDGVPGSSGDARTTEHRPKLLDKMGSFWTAETLKYLYLIFAEPDLVSLDEWVLNTEAHPLRWRMEIEVPESQ